MRLTVVGCSGSYPGPDSPASCYLLEAEHGDGAERRTWRVLLELGNGALGALHRVIDPLSVDAVLISHLHPDHCNDMCGYYVLRSYHPSGPQPRIPVWGPAATPARMADAYGLARDPGMRKVFDFRVLDQPFEVGPFHVVPIPVEHPVDAFGLRITADGATLGYSGDTAPCAGLDEVADGVALLLAEASFRTRDDNPPGIHLTGRDCGEVASRMGSARLVLTHVPPWFEVADALAEARTTYAGPVDAAVAGAVYTLGYSAP